MGWFSPTERQKWAMPSALAPASSHLGLPALDAGAGNLYARALPRGVLMPRFGGDRPAVNHWMRPHDLMGHAYVPGQIILGKFADRFIGHLDDRPMVTIAGSRAGKTSTVLEPNLYLWPGSLLVFDPKASLTIRTARLRQALGHAVYILDPFNQSGEGSSSFNPLAELDPHADTVIDDVAAITQAIIVDEGDSRSRHWNDSARILLTGIILLTLLLPEAERHLVTVRQLLTLSHPKLAAAIDTAKRNKAAEGSPEFFNESKVAVETLLGAMAQAGAAFGGVLASIGNRFLATPSTERGSIFSTAGAQTDFLSSLPLQAISKRSDFRLSALRGARPTSIYLVLPVGRQESHYRWLRLIFQLACVALERLGTYPRGKQPLLLLLEEFATLRHMEVMERAAAYFPEFGIKTHIVLQDIQQLHRHYPASAETILGNAGLIQCFANNDGPTLNYLAARLEGLIRPFELRTAFARQNFSQILMMEGEPPAAAMRLGHEDVEAVRAAMMAKARKMLATPAPRG